MVRAANAHIGPINTGTVLMRQANPVSSDRALASGTIVYYNDIWNYICDSLVHVQLSGPMLASLALLGLSGSMGYSLGWYIWECVCLSCTSGFSLLYLEQSGLIW